MKFRLSVLTILAVSTAFFWSCSHKPDSKGISPRHIFLITLDTTRNDHVCVTREGKELTPHLQKLADRGIRFNSAYSLIPITLPSHSNMMYSLPPHTLKLYNNSQTLQKNPNAPLAEIMQKNGFATGAVVSLGVLMRSRGLARGFAEYHDSFSGGMWYRTADKVNGDAADMLRRFKDKPSFVWLHYSDPHAPYFPPVFKEKFRVFLNGRELYSCNSTDQVQVNLALNLQPGLNKLKFVSEIPVDEKTGKKFRVKHVFYKNLKMKFPDRSGQIKTSIDRKLIRIQSSKKENPDYFSKKPVTRMGILNNFKTEKKVFLSFNFTLHLDSREARNLYPREVSYMDKKLGELFEFLKKIGIYRDSAFIVMGDHGEGLGEHRDMVGHIHYLNKIYLNVPLLVAGAGVSGPEVNDSALVSTLDIAPTVLELAGIAVPPYMKGSSLLNNPGKKRLLLETYSPEAYCDGFSILEFPWQIIYYPEAEKNRMEFIVHNQKDPLGITNMENESRYGRERARFFNEIRGLARILVSGKGKMKPLNEKQKEILKSLGYL